MMMMVNTSKIKVVIQKKTVMIMISLLVRRIYATREASHPFRSRRNETVSVWPVREIEAEMEQMTFPSEPLGEEQCHLHYTATPTMKVEILTASPQAFNLIFMHHLQNSLKCQLIRNQQ